MPAAIDSRHAAAPRRLVACLVACVGALLGLLASGFAQPSPAAVSPGATPPPADFAFAFAGSLSPAQREVILRAARDVRPEARALLVRVSPLVRVEINRGACAVATASCVRAAEPGVERPIVVSLAAGELARGRTRMARAVRRFVVLHELAHAVDAALLSAGGRATFAAVLRGAAAMPCRLRAGSGAPCPAVHELFADEFARWAGGFDRSLTTYATPPLLTPAQFGALVARGAGLQLQRRLFARWPGE